MAATKGWQLLLPRTLRRPCTRPDPDRGGKEGPWLPVQSFYMSERARTDSVRLLDSGPRQSRTYVVLALCQQEESPILVSVCKFDASFQGHDTGKKRWRLLTYTDIAL